MASITWTKLKLRSKWGGEGNSLPKVSLFGGSDGKESACKAGDPDLIHGSGRFSWRR